MAPARVLGPVDDLQVVRPLTQRELAKVVHSHLREARSSVSIPLVSMVSYSIVFRYGPERYFADAKAAGPDGLILPDLPPPEAESICVSTLSNEERGAAAVLLTCAKVEVNPKNTRATTKADFARQRATVPSH